MAPPEISYDLLMTPDMAFVEGMYRLPGRGWQVFVFIRRDVAEPHWLPSTWESAASGTIVHYPRSAVLNQVEVERILSGAPGVLGWSQVRGPDSMQLR